MIICRGRNKLSHNWQVCGYREQNILSLYGIHIVVGYIHLYRPRPIQFYYKAIYAMVRLKIG